MVIGAEGVEDGDRAFNRRGKDLRGKEGQIIKKMI